MLASYFEVKTQRTYTCLTAFIPEYLQHICTLNDDATGICLRTELLLGWPSVSYIAT